MSLYTANKFMEVERTEINKHVFAQVHIYYNRGPQNWFKMKAHTGLVEFIRGEIVWVFDMVHDAAINITNVNP